MSCEFMSYRDKMAFRFSCILRSGMLYSKQMQQIPRLSQTCSQFIHSTSRRDYCDNKQQHGKSKSLGVPESNKPDRAVQPISWKYVLVVFLGGAAIIGFMKYTKMQKDLKLEKQRTQSLGKASLGGSWELVDHTGKPCKSSDFLGKWTILYFGFTHCPDICPDEMEKMVKVVDDLGKEKNMPELIPLFITVDPERDTVSAIAAYISEFSDKIIGLTGSREQLQQATRSYRVYFSSGPKDDDNDYIVDHTIIMYLVNPEGQFVDYYGQNASAQQILNSISVHMMKYNMMKK